MTSTGHTTITFAMNDERCWKDAQQAT
jgi:hypothetical protein